MKRLCVFCGSNAGTNPIYRAEAEKLGRLSSDLPRTGVPERDPWGLRAVALLLLVTAFASVDTVIEAWKAGAFDYVAKPFEPEQLEMVVGRAVEHARLVKENQRLRAELKGGGGAHGIVGKS